MRLLLVSPSFLTRARAPTLRHQQDGACSACIHSVTLPLARHSPHWTIRLSRLHSHTQFSFGFCLRRAVELQQLLFVLMLSARLSRLPASASGSDALIVSGPRHEATLLIDAPHTHPDPRQNSCPKSSSTFVAPNWRIGCRGGQLSSTVACSSSSSSSSLQGITVLRLDLTGCIRCILLISSTETTGTRASPHARTATAVCLSMQLACSRGGKGS